MWKRLNDSGVVLWASKKRAGRNRKPRTRKFYRRPRPGGGQGFSRGKRLP